MTRLIALSLELAAVSVSACGTPQQQNAVLGGALAGRRAGRIGGVGRERRRNASGRGDRRDVRRHDRRGGGASADLRRRVAAARMHPVGQRFQRHPNLHRFLQSFGLQAEVGTRAPQKASL